MSPFLLSALLLIAPPADACAAAVPSPPPPAAGTVAALADTLLTRLYGEGVTFGDFLDGVSPGARPEAWRANFARGVTDPEVLARARTVPGQWRILAVALDACSDSVHTLPYLAALIDALPGVDLRVVGPDAGRAVMEAHRTPDGRPATPTLVVLDEAGREAGCWIERPTPLQAFMTGDAGGRGRMEKFRMKMAWYEADGGWTTVREFVQVLEAAAVGSPVCRRPLPADDAYPGAGPERRPVGGGAGG